MDNYAYKNYTGMYGMQAAQLQYDEGQEGASGQNGNQQILQILQEAHGTQGNKVISRGKNGRTGCGCPWVAVHVPDGFRLPARQNVRKE